MKTEIRKWINGKFYKSITSGKSTIKLMAFTKREKAEIYGNDFYTELKKEILFELRKENHIIPNDIMELITFSLENITSFMDDSEKKERINILFNRLENKEQLLSTIEFKNNNVSNMNSGV